MSILRDGTGHNQNIDPSVYQSTKGSLAQPQSAATDLSFSSLCRPGVQFCWNESDHLLNSHSLTVKVSSSTLKRVSLGKSDKLRITRVASLNRLN